MTTRREFVRFGSLWVAAGAFGLDLGCSGCGSGSTQSAGRPPDAPAPVKSPPAASIPPRNPAPYGVAPPDEAPAPQMDAVCTHTNENILGPYYRPGAPMRASLADGMPGTRFVVRGRVLAPDCKTPLAGALLDFWQADHEGRYDNDGHAPLDPRVYVLRGRMLADRDGRYELSTIIPGRYLNGEQYRPAHIHVRVAAANHRALTTQLYLDGDPYNAVDPFIRPGLTMKLAGDAKAKSSTFDFVLRAA
jgi:catechol 1,2-dioxygenase